MFIIQFPRQNIFLKMEKKKQKRTYHHQDHSLRYCTALCLVLVSLGDIDLQRTIHGDGHQKGGVTAKLDIRDSSGVIGEGSKQIE